MLKTVIIADDLTGANDTGAILAQNGLKVGTLLKTSDIDKFNDFDVLCMTTNSRGIAPSDAYERVKNAANLFKNKEGLFFSKRIDSTLRGNVGVEIDSIIETLGDDTIAIVVASFPNSGRVSIGDFLLVNGVPLEKTEVAKDPTSPVKTSVVTEIVKIQSKYNIGYVSLDKVLKGADVVKNEVLDKVKDNNRIVVIDACTISDINVIAKACVESKLRFVAIDPGTFTAAVAKVLYKKEEKLKVREKVLCGIGSASNLTREQINFLKLKCNPLIVRTNTIEFLDRENREKEINRVIKEVTDKENNYNVLVVTTTTDESDVLDFIEIKDKYNLDKKQCANLITDAISEIVYGVMKKLGDKIGGVYTSGGDVTEDFCTKIEAAGMDVKDEVIPLAIYTRIIGGVFDGKPMITKGGLVGGKDTLFTCISYLQTKISTEYSQQN
jgi:uncharacterized protein YgbK (DUF1537 family)